VATVRFVSCSEFNDRVVYIIRFLLRYKLFEIKNEKRENNDDGRNDVYLQSVRGVRPPPAPSRWLAGRRRYVPKYEKRFSTGFLEIVGWGGDKRIGTTERTSAVYGTDVQ